MTDQQNLDMIFLRSQIRTDQYVVKFEVNKFTGVGLCYVSKEMYNALPQDFGKQMKHKVTQLLDEAISKAVASAIMSIYVEMTK